MTERLPVHDPIRAAFIAACFFATSAAARAQTPPTAQDSPPTDTQRIEKLEAENEELRRRVDLVAEELEHAGLGAIFPRVGESEHGLGPAASKVYAADSSGVSIGGYGEAIYSNFSGSSQTDQIDFLRAVLYAGYKFDEHWLFNSEIEFEHASTEGAGDVSVEFAYLDRLCSPAFNFRAGLILVPMGILNEMHEPTTFFSASRPIVERLILPTTWRENGAGVFGDVGDFDYRAYALSGLAASGFDAAEGLREGRQHGSEAIAEDFALTGRLDYHGAPGLVFGASGWIGNSGQDLTDVGGSDLDVGTAVFDVHAEYRWRALRARALFAHADVDDVADLNAALGFTGTQSVGEELEGYYFELGYDVLAARGSDSQASLTPFVRWETYDTQAKVPAGFASDPANDVDVLTFGVAYQPIDQLIFKLDASNIEDDAGGGVDQINVALGYIF